MAAKHVTEAIEALLALTELVERRRNQLAREVGLSPLQATLVEEIGRESFMPSLFARDRERSAPAVSRALRGLADKGLVRAAIAEGDARQRDYRLTAAGRRVFGRLEALRRDAIDAVWADLPKADVERFSRFADRLAERLDEYARGAEA